MNWKSLKKEILSSDSDFNDESKFILGLDIGNSTSTISYWNFNLNEPQIIDISGGYGNPAMPTVVQYIPENKEWVFGEYALLNKGYFKDLTFTNLVDRLGTKEILEVDGKSMSIPQILGRFIKALVETSININPNAEISGVVVAVPTYMDETSKTELKRAIDIAGLEKEFIGFVTDRECAIKYYYYGEKEAVAEKIVMIDYGSREIRGGVYEIIPRGDTLDITAMSSIVNEEIAAQKVDQLVRDLFVKYYCNGTKKYINEIDNATKLQLEAFAYQNRSILFQNIDKAVKIYFNFAFPAFQKTISQEETTEFIIPLQNKLGHFLSEVCNKVVRHPIDTSEITKVICLGGGFEMRWAKETVDNMFPSSKIVTMKGAKGITSQGACISAVIELGLLKKIKYNIKDFNIVEYDIGIKAISDKREQFIALIEKGSFWWKKHDEKIFILNADKAENPLIHVYCKNDSGEEVSLVTIDLKELPDRPKRTTRLKMNINFKTYNTVTIGIKDLGLGEFFEPSDFEKNVEVKI